MIAWGLCLVGRTAMEDEDNLVRTGREDARSKLRCAVPQLVVAQTGYCGSPSPNQDGETDWPGATPSIPSVALTFARAKHRVFRLVMSDL